ncbi:MAG: hypothetical protein H6Q60_1555, partial [Oscillospiraceae bacterium]|nr:hypothetical protein [Oscillospiraceae bacterium]
IRLTSTKDVLPDGATLKVTAITSGTSYTAAQTALAGKVDQFEIYTIATQTSAGVDTAPTGAVSLYFPIPDGYTDTRVQVYQIADDGTATLISGSVENGYYVISTTTLGTFALVEESAGVLDKFTDIPDGHWARDYIATAVEKGLFSGISETEFSPEGKMTRAMLFTVLYRVSGKTDESSGELWYSTPMAWAEETAISDGTNPDESITREQLVTMLYRYAGSPETSGDFSAFQDADMVSSYAEDALKWAVAQGIVAGTEDGRLNPAGTASRAEVATILVRYLSEA